MTLVMSSPVTAADNAHERALLDTLASLNSVLVAFSGGVDSALVLAAAVRALGTRSVLAASAASASVPRAELAGAAALARALGARHLVIPTGETERADYRRNGADRCYFCKATMLSRMLAEADRHGVAYVATGTNRDDVLSGLRPGIAAGDERGVRTPLHEVGMGKEAVRRLAAAWGLPVWDKPASPCLASRIRHGVPVTVARLARVERAELAVRELLGRHALAVRDLRVRDLGGRVRVEVDSDQVARIGPLAGQLRQAINQAGFPLDSPMTVAEFRSGALSGGPRARPARQSASDG